MLYQEIHKTHYIIFENVYSTICDLPETPQLNGLNEYCLHILVPSLLTDIYS